MTCPAGRQLNTVCLRGWHVTICPEDRLARDHTLSPPPFLARRCYLFNLRLLLRAGVFAACDLFRSTIVHRIFNVGHTDAQRRKRPNVV